MEPMEMGADDLIKYFKLKVEEAISVLPQIPESRRIEVWSYWQVISVAVKAAVGGRGRLVAKRPKLEGSRGRGRPRGRPRLYARQPQSSSLVGKDVRHLLPTTPHFKGEESGDGGIGSGDESHAVGMQGEKNDKNNVALLKNADTSPPEVPSSCVNSNTTADEDSSARDNIDSGKCIVTANGDTGANPCPAEEGSAKVRRLSPNHEKDAFRSDQVTDQQALTSRVPENSTALVSHVLENTTVDQQEGAVTFTAIIESTQIHGNQETVVMVTEETSSHDNPSADEVSSVPTDVTKYSLVTAGNLTTQVTAEAISTGSKTNLSKVVTSGDSSEAASGSLQHRSDPLPAKPKRGRPPKNHRMQILQGTPTSSASDQNKDVAKKPSTAALAGDDSRAQTDDQTSSDKIAKEERSQDSKLLSIITALELEVKKVAEEIFPKSAASDRDKVRRSKRRVAPNRDKLFCYFDQAERGEKGEEEGGGVEEGQGGGKEEEDEEEDAKCSAGNEGKKSDATEENKEERTEEEREQERTCQVCNAVLMSASSMAAHMRIHTGERPFACPVCSKCFTTKGNCERHEVTHVGLKAFSCPECSKHFTERKSLKIHMRSHTGERPYACQVCGMRFFQTGTLKTHMDRHTGHKGHLCELCGKAFRQGCQLRVHMRRHAKDMAFPCQHCCKRFYTKCDKERHELKHTGERPFACDQCPDTFTRQQYLREHQNTHLGRRPYRCVVCNLSFHDFASCHRHVNKHKTTVLTEEESPQQIHVEVPPDTPADQVMEQVQAILNQQNLAGYHTAHIQTLVLPEQSAATHIDSTPAADTTTTITTTISSTAETETEGGGGDQSSSSSAQTLLNKLMTGAEDPMEVYHVTLVNAAGQPDIAVTGETTQVLHTVSAADFSAINLLASATTQLSLP